MRGSVSLALAGSIPVRLRQPSDDPAGVGKTQAMCDRGGARWQFLIRFARGLSRSEMEMDDSRRSLPAVHELLSDEFCERHGHDRVAMWARRLLERARKSSKPPSKPELLKELERCLAGGLRPAINASGVVLHTNLGRAPWSDAAVQAALAATSYCTVELDAAGGRGHRGSAVEERLVALTGAEAAVVVNNCAAAVMLCLRALAKDREVIVSRGELVDIGGGFRGPDVLEESGCRLVEVGTTNRSHLTDFRDAVGEATGAILRVHHSNFRQTGFVAEAGLDKLCALGPPVVVDAGSGALIAMAGEIRIQELLGSGAQLVCFSGDKLLGGPQAGIIVGQHRWVDLLRRHPLMRALRPDKVTLAALQSTLDDWLTGRAVPCQKMIQTSQEELRQVVQGWLNALPTGVRASIEEVEGAIGGGTVPGRSWPSIALAIESPSPVCLREHLLAGEPAVVARISHDRLLLDARTVAPVGQAGALLERLLEAISAVGDTGS